MASGIQSASLENMVGDFRFFFLSIQHDFATGWMSLDLAVQFSDTFVPIRNLCRQTNHYIQHNPGAVI
jgi:hypothetical protein